MVWVRAGIGKRPFSPRASFLTTPPPQLPFLTIYYTAYIYIITRTLPIRRCRLRIKPANLPFFYSRTIHFFFLLFFPSKFDNACTNYKIILLDYDRALLSLTYSSTPFFLVFRSHSLKSKMDIRNDNREVLLISCVEYEVVDRPPRRR